MQHEQLTAAENRTAVVIGAGLAGITAARDLAAAGARVVVLEARTRVGGRVWSVELPSGAVGEMGAEWIMPGDDALTELCDEVGVRLVSVGSDYRRRKPAGPGAAAPEDQDRALAQADAALRALEPAQRDRVSLGSFLAGLDADARAVAGIVSRLQGTCAMELDDVPLAAVAGEGLFDATPRRYRRAAGGNQTIAMSAASSLHDLRLGQRVTAIVHDPLGVRVRGRAAGGAFEVRARFAVIAVPHPLVLETSFDPPLSPDRMGMLSRLPMGPASKLVIPTEGPPPLLSVQSVQLPFWCWTGAGGDGAVRSCLTSFAGSGPAQDALGTGGADPSRWRDRIAQLVPDVSLAGESVLKAWARDDLARGAYSGIDRASMPIMDRLAGPVGTLFFAGEYTAGTDHHATMNGAVLSGHRAARQALPLLARS